MRTPTLSRSFSSSTLSSGGAKSMFSALLLVTLACAHRAEAEAPPVDAWTPSAEEEAVYRALSMRDQGPSCEDLDAMAKDPVATLINITEHATMPPWVGVRATQCLVSRHAEDAKSTLSAWIVDPNKRGLAFVISDNTATMPEPVALELARAGLTGPHGADLKRRLAKSSWPSVVQLSAELSPPVQK